MNNKTFAIGVLCVTAVILLVANLLPQSPAYGIGTAIRDRDYQLVTARAQTGGESLYVVDNKTGLVAVFVYEPSARALQLKAIQPINAAFAR